MQLAASAANCGYFCHYDQGGVFPPKILRLTGLLMGTKQLHNHLVHLGRRIGRQNIKILLALDVCCSGGS